MKRRLPKLRTVLLTDEHGKEGKTMDSVTELCKSAQNSIETINEENADECSGAYVSMQDIFSD